MASKLPVWGIDVGQCSLKAIKLQESDEKVELVALDIVEHDTILSESDTDAAEITKKAIETFLSRNDLAESQVVVSVPGQQTLTRFTKMPPVERKKIPDMVQYEASQQIPFDMDEVVWDYQVFTEDDSPDVEVGIFAIRKELIRNYLMQFTDAGIEPIIVQASPMASYNAARYEFPPAENKATILLDMGALATDLIVMEGTRIWSRPVPVGGNKFTEALVSAFKLSFAKAERLKRNAASSKHARQVFQAMRPIFADLVSEIQRSIGFYTSTHREADITSVIGMGNAFKLPGLQKFLQQNLHLETHRFSGFKNTKVVATAKTQELKDNIMSFAVAHGLALQGLGHGTVEANLLPLEVRRTILWRKKKLWFVASVASLALAAVALWVGNVMAGGQIDAGMGSMTSLRPLPCSNIDAAEKALAGANAGAPLERAAKVAGAAERLKSELTKADSEKSSDEATLKTMAELPDNNIYIPRLLSVIHRSFGESIDSELIDSKTPREYRERARQTPRVERREAWIEKLTMQYDPKAPEVVWDPKANRGKTQPGWAIELTGRTTIPQGEAEPWVQDAIIATMNRIGKEPGRGIHFEMVKLEGAETWTSSSQSGMDFAAPPAGSGGNRGPTVRGGARARGRRGIMQPRETRTPNPRARGRGGSASDGVGSPVARGNSGSLVSLSDELAELREKYKKEDPLLGENCLTDCRFLIRAIVRKADTPKELIPEEYQEKKEDGKQKAGKQEAETKQQ